jgi:ZIP family zinc transporter
MSLILGFSAGVMIYVSFIELLHTSLDNIGFLRSNIGFFAGIALIALLDVLIPHEYKHEDVGHLASLLKRRKVQSRLEEPVGTSGINEPSSFERGRHGKMKGAPAFVKSKQQSYLMRTGVLIAIGIAIHNLPEGLVVFSSGLAGDTSFGILVAVAIAIHNIPEGISVSIPIMQATGNRKMAFIYSFGAGLVEPIGALIGYAILAPFLTETLIYAMMAFAAGVMVYISLDEILPTAHMFGEEHLVILGTILGMIVMALSIYIIL